MKNVTRARIIIMTCIIVIISFLTPDLSGQTDPENQLPQFLLPTFAKSLVKMKDGRELAATINYNMVDEEMIFEQKGVYMALEKPNEIDTLYLQNRKFIPVEMAFYEVLNKGQVPIFIQHKSKYTPKGTPTAYGMTSKTVGPSKVLTMRAGNQVRQVDLPENVEVTPATIYWVKKGDQMNKFTSERQFLKLFPDYEANLKEFIKTNGIDFKSREDLLRLGNFCNELVK
jgi:hypothetical protein